MSAGRSESGVARVVDGPSTGLAARVLSAQLAVSRLVRRVHGRAERQTSRVGEDAPSRSLEPAVQGARVQESLNLGRLVVGSEVKVCAHLARRLVEPLEEQLDGRAVIVVPL